LSRKLACLLLYVSVAAVFADEIDHAENNQELAEVVVRASRIANTQPAGSYASLATSLRFDPQTELQSRGLPEGQADVAVRGGIFENTGFVIGASTIMDPQTGHYVAGLPVDPGFLSAPRLLTGVDNSLAGFNIFYQSGCPLSWLLSVSRSTLPPSASMT